MSYLSDILEQPQVLRSLVESYQDSPLWSELGQMAARDTDKPMVLTGMGGSYYALYPTWLALNQAGLRAIQIEASELVHYVPELLQACSLLVVVSQSGESVEVRRLLELVPEATQVVSVTNLADNWLNRHSTLALVTAAGAEVGVATKTYTSSLALLHLLTRCLTQQLQNQDYSDLLDLAATMEILLDRWQDWLAPAEDHLATCSFFSLLGRGSSVASAMDGALILKEAARVPAMGLSGGQFRHGPMEAVSPDAGILLFAHQGRTWELSQRLASEIASHDGRVVCVGQGVADPKVVSLALPLVSEWYRPMLDILAVQLLAAQLAARAGIVPGEFRWSGKVIQVE